MQEFWFCAGCKSMNRASDKVCYKCRAPKEQATLATVAHRQEGVVLTPGLDEEHREVAWALMSRNSYISAWRLGYVAAALIVLYLILGIIFVLEQGTLLGIYLLAPDRLDSLESVLPGAVLAVTDLAVVIALIAAVAVHSCFLGITSMNAPALGSGSPRFDPVRAGLWWIESHLWAIRGGLAFVGPPLLCFIGIAFGGVILGLATGLVWAVCAFWLLGDPITNLGKPRRLLEDLWTRLGVPGSADSRVVTWWSAAWGTAFGVAYAVSALTFIAIIVVALVEIVLAIGGAELQPASERQTTAVLAVTYVLVVTIELAAYVMSLWLLAQITVGLAQRQRVREAWVQSGSAAPGSAASAAGSAGGLGAPGSVGPQPGAPQPGAPGSVGPQPGAPQPGAPLPQEPAAPFGYAARPGFAQPAGLPPRPTPAPATQPEGQAPSSAGVGEEEAGPTDRPVIQPSRTLPRYGSPLSVEPRRPPGSPPSDLDRGGTV
jgi:hypothetical protein